MRGRRFLLTFLLGACVADPPSVDKTEAPIHGGTTDTADPAIVSIYMEGSIGGAQCTGTLISPHVVLTAAHCEDVFSTFYVHFGTYFDFDDSANWVGVLRHTHHSGWGGENQLENGNDFALLRIDSGATNGASPLPINRAAISTGNDGDPIRLVGFGETAQGRGDSDRKRMVTSTVTDVWPKFVWYGSTSKNICSGDSGGPNLMDFGSGEVVVGVTSFGPANAASGTCGDYGAGGRVDKVATWIDDWVTTNDVVGCGSGDGCSAACSSPDPDCPCASDGFCTTACSDSDTDPDCPRNCSAEGTCVPSGCPRPDPDCGTPDPCGADGNCQASCPTRDPDCPAGGVGEPCIEGSDCTSTICIPASDDPRIQYCSGSCDPANASSCPENMACVDASGGAHICVYNAPTPGAIGSHCTGSQDCASRLCVPVDGQDTCIDVCNQGMCPNGFECVATADAQNVCVPAGGGDDGGCQVAPGRAGGSGGVLGGIALTALLSLCISIVLRRRA